MTEPPRPDPDALLALAAEGRGRLKVFLGAAPGVGKTVQMLAEGRRLLAAGTDVLVGLVETHGRAETEAAIGPLPVLPRRAVPYRGQALAEFDLDAALARRPAVLLLDELAHSNAPGSRHPKRWQDVEELRDAGIEVWTTMNVQHLEGLSDTVARVTGIRVAETVPDRVLREADAVALVDIPPAELLERLRQGRIYRPDQAERALRGFFREGSLAALREMALRRTAERVDADVTGWMRRNAVAGPWPVGDRVLVLIPGGAEAEAVLHHARRIADALRAPLLALHVERPGGTGDPAPGLRLAEDLGAEAEVVAAADLPAAVLAHARARNVSHIVLGRGRPARWRRLLGRTLIGALARRAADFTLHVVAGPPPATRRPAAPRRALPGWLGLAAVPALVAAATLVCLGLDGTVPDASFGMVYLVAVVALAAWLGPAHAAAGAALSFAAWNFLFLPPRYTLVIASAQDVLGAVVFGVVAALLSGTTGRLGRSVRAAAARLAALRRLSALARRLNAQSSMPELQGAIAEAARQAAGCPACLLLPLDAALQSVFGADLAPPDAPPGASGPPEPVLRAASPADAVPDEAAMAAARWALANGREAGRGTATLPATPWRFLPLRAAREEGEAVIGLLGLLPGQAGRGMDDPEADRTLDALLDQAAVALERARLAELGARRRARGEAEALRTALLTSLGHDLRTPLTAIRGAAETLRTVGAALPEATRADLLATVEEEATRLARWMTAIIDMVRLESGELQARREPVDPAGALREAAARAGHAYPGRAVRVAAPPGLPAPMLDPVLLDRVLENLLDNALKYSGPSGTVLAEARREGAWVSFSVEDDGPGIPPAALPQVFAPFFRAARADRVAAGSGLGLAICRGLVTAMGGTIAAESPVRDGHGTRVTARFPA
ncbi:sensor histidine kinase KdpD [Roseomonas sp. NAR14]|uniref:histidine kinase n=1 Tax=Roseomonas acroporae TaxID=2937791 RepID=A0A9X1YAS3_9PROT|nr:sensor histidine kinase KdpD [Roseomonas acroporae]MCK8786292.1 sensor histidine kinase KdpD [Roseomonas acroporae]